MPPIDKAFTATKGDLKGIKYREVVYSGDLNTELIRYSNGSKLFDHRMVPYSGHGFNSKLKVRYSNGRNHFSNFHATFHFALTVLCM